MFVNPIFYLNKLRKIKQIISEKIIIFEMHIVSRDIKITVSEWVKPAGCNIF